MMQEEKRHNEAAVSEAVTEREITVNGTRVRLVFPESPRADVRSHVLNILKDAYIRRKISA